jgi:hypothetical protein
MSRLIALSLTLTTMRTGTILGITATLSDSFGALAERLLWRNSADPFGVGTRLKWTLNVRHERHA